MLLLPLILAANAPVKAVVAMPSSPDLGKAEAKCRADESGPALLIDIDGLKDRKGRLKLEIYPPNDPDFLMDDNVLIAQGKTFRRVEEDVPKAGPVQLCVRVPAAGVYSVMVLHDRDSNRKFGLFVDGVGFGSNPKLGLSKPKAAATHVTAGPGMTHTTIKIRYYFG
jgi:uncharacterized protein (DUF2141 family)